jgi:hypothetical protein
MQRLRLMVTGQLTMNPFIIVGDLDLSMWAVLLMA